MIYRAMAINLNIFLLEPRTKGPGYEAIAMRTPVQQRFSLRLAPNKPCMILVGHCTVEAAMQYAIDTSPAIIA